MLISTSCVSTWPTANRYGLAAPRCLVCTNSLAYQCSRSRSILAFTYPQPLCLKIEPSGIQKRMPTSPSTHRLPEVSVVPSFERQLVSFITARLIPSLLLCCTTVQLGKQQNCFLRVHRHIDVDASTLRRTVLEHRFVVLATTTTTTTTTTTMPSETSNGS